MYGIHPIPKTCPLFVFKDPETKYMVRIYQSVFFEKQLMLKDTDCSVLKKRINI